MGANWTQEQTRIEDGKKLAQRALSVVPVGGGYDCEREGLLASHEKLMATLAYKEAKALCGEPGTDDAAGKLRMRAWEIGFVKARAHLEQARRMYHRAGHVFLDSENDKQVQATLHWVLTQAISLDRLLGDSGADFGWDEDHVRDFGATSEQQLWDLAFQSATVAARGNSDEVWGHGMLAELWLLKLFEPLSEQGVQRARTLAKEHATSMAKLSFASASLPVFSTKRQLNRYATFWTEEFRSDLGLSPDGEERWKRVRAAAAELVELLSRFESEDREE
jgi:hypothetical protein